MTYKLHIQVYIYTHKNTWTYIDKHIKIQGIIPKSLRKKKMENLILLCSGTKTMGGVKPVKKTSSSHPLKEIYNGGTNISKHNKTCHITDSTYRSY